jgi:FkbM family methyltransferase
VAVTPARNDFRRWSAYGARRVALAPRTIVRRRRLALDGLARAMYELHYYSDGVNAFMAASLKHPDLLTEVDLDEAGVVVDAGAFTGEWASAIHGRYGARVVAFEPAPSSVAELEERFADVPSVSVVAAGLGAADGRASLGLAGPGSSFHDDDAPWGTVEVAVRDAASALDDLGVDEIDLLKLNIEGSEYDVLDRLEITGWLPRIRQVSVQFHEWHPGAHRRRRRNRAALARTHDEQWCYPWVWELWRRR